MSADLKAAVLAVLEEWTSPGGALHVEEDERAEFDGEILAAFRHAE